MPIQVSRTIAAKEHIYQLQNLASFTVFYQSRNKNNVHTVSIYIMIAALRKTKKVYKKLIFSVLMLKSHIRNCVCKCANMQTDKYMQRISIVQLMGYLPISSKAWRRQKGEIINVKYMLCRLTDPSSPPFLIYILLDNTFLLPTIRMHLQKEIF